jgi:hypothetical protein
VAQIRRNQRALTSNSTTVSTQPRVDAKLIDRLTSHNVSLESSGDRDDTERGKSRELHDRPNLKPNDPNSHLSSSALEKTLSADRNSKK